MMIQIGNRVNNNVINEVISLFGHSGSAKFGCVIVVGDHYGLQISID